jgi:hypothetical protein
LSVPLVLKFASTSVTGSTLPLPVTVDWTIPFSAVTISRVVRAWLAGGPISVSAATTTAAPTSTSSSMCQGRLGPDVIRGRASSFAMPGHQEMNLSDPPERWPCKA